MHTTTKKQTTQFIKWAEEMNRYFFQGKHTDGQQMCEKVFNITNY